MKRVIPFLLVAIVLVSCNSAKHGEVVYDVPEYTEPNWMDVDNYLCHQDQWMHVPDKMLESPMLARLVDAYNANVVWHSVKADMECFWRWDVYTDSAMVAMDLSIIRDEATRTAASHLCEETAQAQRDESIDVNIAMNAYLELISTTYHVNAIAAPDSLSVDAYWEAMEKSNWVANWKELSVLRGQSDTVHQAFLLHAMDTASTFNARCVYALEYAHSSEDGPDFEEAIPYLVKCLTAGQYSPLLKELWQTWRVMQSCMMGHSKDSDIPNAEYNRLRMIACYTMLCHIQDHPDDLLAINNYLVISFLDNICRFGPYGFGNQSVLEQAECFPEYFEKIFGAE